MTIPLPSNIQLLVKQNTHPGLAIDKYVDSYGLHGGWSENVQKPALNNLVKLSKIEPAELHYTSLQNRHKTTMADLGAILFEAVTTNPLAIHLAKGSALENAGICLHPIHGFVYLPGSGLKGMSRAFAETQWLDRQPDKIVAWQTIEQVFGWAPNSDDNKSWKPDGIPKRGKDDKESAGNIIFHDAWPSKWPSIQIDILNNHHSKYYSSKINNDAPGDWEEPIPVYFPSIAAGASFVFFISLRKTQNPQTDEILKKLAIEWLIGALNLNGAGAKTASGYGRFEIPSSLVMPNLGSSDNYLEFKATLELVTPAFLAGAMQTKEDCDLRPATMKGLLRWWWRTMHSGFITVNELRNLESLLWGDTNNSGAISISLNKVDNGVMPEQFGKVGIARKNNLPLPPNKKTTQGLFYSSYGMAENGKPQRWYAPQKSAWDIRIFVRNLKIKASKSSVILNIPANMVMDQAKLSLWWLCYLGGVGAKSRKGFGSLQMPKELSELDGRKFNTPFGSPLREKLELPSNFFIENNAVSPSLRLMATFLGEGDGITETKDSVSNNPWVVLDKIGYSIQSFAQRYKHRREKKALGLPRKIGDPASGTFRCDLERHSSPAFFHCFKKDENNISVRWGAFPSSRLPDIQTSKDFLREFLQDFSI